MKTVIIEYGSKSHLSEVTNLSQEDLISKIPVMVKEQNYYYQFQKVNRSKMQYKSGLEKIHKEK